MWNLLYEMSKKDNSIFNNSKSTNKPEWKLRQNKTAFQIVFKIDIPLNTFVMRRLQ